MSHSIARMSIGTGILLCVFALAWIWNGHMQRSLAEERDRERAALGLETAPRSVDGAQTANPLAADPAVASSTAATRGGSAILIGRPAAGATRSAYAVDAAAARPPAGSVQQASTPLAAPTDATRALDGARVPGQPGSQPTAQPQRAEQPALPSVPALTNTHWKVEAGQTLLSILRARYGHAEATLVERIATLNGLDDPSRLTVGQLLVLPPLDEPARAVGSRAGADVR